MKISKWLVAAVIALNCVGTAATAQPRPAKRALSYAQLVAEKEVFLHHDLRGLALYVPGVRGALEPAAQTWHGAPSASSAEVQSAFRSGSRALLVTKASPSTVAVMPLIRQDGQTIGALALEFRENDPRAALAKLDAAAAIRDEIAQIVPKAETLNDPYIEGYDSGDTVAQMINQTLMARHPDVATIAIHLTAPGDTKNRVWGINRPNFIGRDSDEIDTDTEKTGRIVMQVIPATHRMEVHMPLLSRAGDLYGTLCTVYFFKNSSESADYYGRSLAMMEEARELVPRERADLFRRLSDLGH